MLAVMLVSRAGNSASRAGNSDHDSGAERQCLDRIYLWRAHAVAHTAALVKVVRCVVGPSQSLSPRQPTRAATPGITGGEAGSGGSR